MAGGESVLDEDRSIRENLVAAGRRWLTKDTEDGRPGVAAGSVKPTPSDAERLDDGSVGGDLYEAIGAAGCADGETGEPNDERMREIFAAFDVVGDALVDRTERPDRTVVEVPDDRRAERAVRAVLTVNDLGDPETSLGDVRETQAAETLREEAYEPGEIFHGLIDDHADEIEFDTQPVDEHLDEVVEKLDGDPSEAEIAGLYAAAGAFARGTDGPGDVRLRTRMALAAAVSAVRSDGATDGVADGIAPASESDPEALSTVLGNVDTDRDRTPRDQLAVASRRMVEQGKGALYVWLAGRDSELGPGGAVESGADTGSSGRGGPVDDESERARTL